MFKRLKYLATLLVLTQLFVLTFPIQSTYGLDAKDTATSFLESARSKMLWKADYRGAIQDLNKAIELNPNHDEAFYLRGNAKASLEDSRGAILDFNKAIELNPNHDAAFVGRGTEKANLKDYKGAIQDFNKAIELNPYSFLSLKIFYFRGLAKHFLGDHRGAIQDYNKMLESDPKSPAAFFGRGTAKISLGQKNSGCLDLSKAGELGSPLAYDLIKKHCN